MVWAIVGIVAVLVVVAVAAAGSRRSAGQSAGRLGPVVDTYGLKSQRRDAAGRRAWRGNLKGLTLEIHEDEESETIEVAVVWDKGGDGRNAKPPLFSVLAPLAANISEESVGRDHFAGRDTHRDALAEGRLVNNDMFEALIGVTRRQDNLSDGTRFLHPDRITSLVNAPAKSVVQTVSATLERLVSFGQAWREHATDKTTIDRLRLARLTSGYPGAQNWALRLIILKFRDQASSGEIYAGYQHPELQVRFSSHMDKLPADAMRTALRQASPRTGSPADMDDAGALMTTHPEAWPSDASERIFHVVLKHASRDRQTRLVALAARGRLAFRPKPLLQMVLTQTGYVHDEETQLELVRLIHAKGRDGTEEAILETLSPAGMSDRDRKQRWQLLGNAVVIALFEALSDHGGEATLDLFRALGDAAMTHKSQLDAAIAMVNKIKANMERIEQAFAQMAADSEDGAEAGADDAATG